MSLNDMHNAGFTQPMMAQHNMKFVLGSKQNRQQYAHFFRVFKNSNGSDEGQQTGGLE